jgi:hypothetical protein
MLGFDRPIVMVIGRGRTRVRVLLVDCFGGHTLHVRRGRRMLGVVSCQSLDGSAWFHCHEGGRLVFDSLALAVLHAIEVSRS